MTYKKVKFNTSSYHQEITGETAPNGDPGFRKLFHLIIVKHQPPVTISTLLSPGVPIKNNLETAIRVSFTPTYIPYVFLCPRLLTAQLQ